MIQHPPRVAERLLAHALGRREEARTILGDLAEDFAAHAGKHGLARARLWYWREALALTAAAATGRLLGRPLARNSRASAGTGRRRSETIGAIQDVRYALRAIRWDPAFFVFATAIIGLGVGASTAVFSVASPLFLRPLPFEEPERLVVIENDAGGGGLSAVTSRTGNLRDFRVRTSSFAGLAGYNAFFDQGSYNLVGAGGPERLIGVGVTHDFLDVLGVDPLIGRSFEHEEGLWDGPEAVILTHGFWVRRFAGDPSIVGTTLTLDEVPRQVVGVLPPSFDFSSVFAPAIPVDILLPWPISDETDAWGNTTTIIGRLRPGASIDAAQADLESVIRALEEADPNRWGLGATTSGLQERIGRPVRSAMILLAAAAALVMLIVCVNLSNMLLARSPRRQREMAVRRTLGATRARLVRQLLTESVIVSLCGGALGVTLAVAATRFVAGTSGLDIPMLSTIAVDGTALAFTTAIAVAAGLAVGVVPALQIAEGEEAKALGGSARGSSSGRGSRRLRELLVVSEVAMACVLLVLGGLVLRSFRRVMDVDLGFEAENALAWQLSTSRSFDTLTEIVAYYDEIVASVETVPGVEAAGLVDALPLGRNRTWVTRVVGVTDDADDGISFFPHVVGPRYVTAMGIPLLEGRHFSANDTRDTSPVVIVNETAARTMFPRGNAIGHFVRMWYGDAEVVGVVGDVKHRALELAADREIYFPMSQVWDFNTLDLVVRTPLPPDAVVGPVSAAIGSVDPGLPTEDFTIVDSVVERSVSPRRFTLQLLAAFAACGLLLAGLGIYGVLSYSVTERIPEIGIRMALGESATAVRRAVVVRTLGLAGIGIVLGSGVSLASTRLIRSLLYEVEPTDPMTFFTMIALLFAVALVSGLVPALRASRTDSATALRSA